MVKDQKSIVFLTHGEGEKSHDFLLFVILKESVGSLFIHLISLCSVSLSVSISRSLGISPDPVSYPISYPDQCPHDISPPLETYVSARPYPKSTPTNET